MSMTLGLTVIALATLSAGVEADFIARVEATELVFNRKPTQRVERDVDGNIVRLRLDHMQLSAGDFRAIGQLTTLRSLGLSGANVTDDDLQHLQGLTQLEGLSLSSTGISDEAIDVLVEFPALRSLCLGDVNITPEAITRLKDEFHARDRRLSLGYYQRRE